MLPAPGEFLSGRFFLFVLFVVHGCILMTRKQLLLSSLSLIIVICLGFYLTINYAQAPSITELSEIILEHEPTLSSQIIPDSDLPPEGTRSLFDHLIAQNNGLPYPFSKMIDLLTEQHPEKLPPLQLLIPDGRSLLKGQANFEFPRILVAPDFQEANTPVGLGQINHGQLFLGFVEAANEIEVISYNEAAGRYEYQLVQDYCEGCIPKLVYARRAICLTCHQGGTPIFSQRPWEETNAQGKIAHAIKTARQNDSDYVGVPLVQTLATPERFDELTDIGSFAIATQRVWLDGCGEQGNECRRQLLRLAMEYADQPGQFNPQSEQVKYLKALWTQHFPAQGIAVPESDIRSRDPLGSNNNFTDWLYDIFTPDIEFGEGAKTNEDLSAFEKLPPLPPALDPLTPRPAKKLLTKEDIDGIYGIARFFSDADITSLSAHFDYKIDLLLAYIDTLPLEHFSAAPFSRAQMMSLLLGRDQEYCCLDTREMSAPIASGVPPLEIVKHTELLAFEAYCFSCHRGNPAKRLDFMSGDTEQAVLENIQAKAEIRDVLDWERYLNTDKASTLMPPADSIQYQKLKQAGADERKKMRDSVPSMFSF
jgi:hypothetical protein